MDDGISALEMDSVFPGHMTSVCEASVTSSVASVLNTCGVHERLPGSLLPVCLPDQEEVGVHLLLCSRRKNNPSRVLEGSWKRSWKGPGLVEFSGSSSDDSSMPDNEMKTNVAAV